MEGQAKMTLAPSAKDERMRSNIVTKSGDRHRELSNLNLDPGEG